MNEATMTPPQAIVVVETAAKVFSNFQKNLKGTRSRLVRVNSYGELQKILSGQAVEWVLCDSEVKEGNEYVWSSILENHPEVCLLVFYDPSEPTMSKRLFDSGVLAIEVDKLVAPDCSVLFHILSVLHETDVRMRKLRRNFRAKERLTEAGETTVIVEDQNMLVIGARPA